MSSAVCVCVCLFSRKIRRAGSKGYMLKLLHVGSSTKKQLTIKVKFSKTVLEITVSDNPSTFK